MKRLGILLTALALCIDATPLKKAPVPVVIWHGLGDTYTNPGLGELADEIKMRYPDTFVHLIQVEEDGGADQRATFFGDANEQVQTVCAQLAALPELQDGFDAIGLSQGGQLMRAYVERCNDPPVRHLITLGSQHMGVSATPPCRGPTDFGCQILKRLAESGSVYSSYAQTHIVPAQYFRDPANIEKYLEANAFLRDINNERVGDEQPDETLDDEPRDKDYKKRFSSLEKLVLFRFSDDHTVIPSTSAWFTLPNKTASPPPPLPAVPLPFDALPLYAKDYIGLRKLDEAGKVELRECEGEHMRIDRACWDEVMDHLGNGKRPSPGLVVQQ